MRIVKNTTHAGMAELSGRSGNPKSPPHGGPGVLSIRSRSFPLLNTQLQEFKDSLKCNSKNESHPDACSCHYDGGICA